MQQMLLVAGENAIRGLSLVTLVGGLQHERGVAAYYRG